MVNLILAAVLVVIVGAAVAYIIKEKKRGVKCVGCPYAEQCAKRGKCSSVEDGVGN